MIDEERKLWETNRDKARRPRGFSFWCGACDAAHVWAGQKCPKCGSRASSKVRNKPGKDG
ncbi:hypothetical protein ADL19_14745 [Streptomyces purpurogeneiscleroticus]|nr:hypothetical protein ADL19_14745 [Streptomyces purpurogeneiscleroticus]